MNRHTTAFSACCTSFIAARKYQSGSCVSSMYICIANAQASEHRWTFTLPPPGTMMTPTSTQCPTTRFAPAVNCSCKMHLRLVLTGTPFSVPICCPQVCGARLVCIANNCDVALPYNDVFKLSRHILSISRNTKTASTAEYLTPYTWTAIPLSQWLSQ